VIRSGTSATARAEQPQLNPKQKWADEFLRRKRTPHISDYICSAMANTSTLVAIAIVIVLATYVVPLLLSEYFPVQSLWKQRNGKPVVQTESYQGRTFLITGANGAFGSRAAKLVAQRDVETLVLVDLNDCNRVKDEIQAELKEANKPMPNILVWQIDMMSYAGCQELGRKARELKNLDHALMTAGILAFARRESPEGWETCKSSAWRIRHGMC